ncbi:hypothetical protein [Shewanella colwelliana]|uniref:hypothetical protein n=1 Tax=Shewanella colwelliana TaxID=23 RepID=UPI00299D1F71|nr:hypothetical protein [Shewanella colwelliana]MDX1281400.1 hypothetical protein [Shewanella colwelliana]
MIKVSTIIAITLVISLAALVLANLFATSLLAFQRDLINGFSIVVLGIVAVDLLFIILKKRKTVSEKAKETD